MFDVYKIRKDFPMLNGIKMQGKDLIYFDNGATTLKPMAVIEACMEYYKSYTANAHRGDYDLSHIVDVKFEGVRKKVGQFIKCDEKEVVFTSGASASLNMIAYGIGEVFIEEGDEILINEAEHASNVLPWFHLAQTKKAIIKYIPLLPNGKISIEGLKQTISKKTKVVSFAHVSNVLGFINDAKEITAIAHSVGALSVVDAAQSVPHIEIDVKDINCDFLCFSAHKMNGPTGIGVLFGKYHYLEQIPPYMLGGGMNARFELCGIASWQKAPHKFEAGTQNIEGVIGLGAAIDYLSNIGLNNIHQHEIKIRAYALEKMKATGKVTIYNEEADSGIITFNINDVFAQDAASHFNSYGIAVRAGNHCAKMLNDFLKTPATVRASFSLYNTIEEVDLFIEAIEKGSDFLDVFFK